jgi:hypothetical protein
MTNGLANQLIPPFPFSLFTHLFIALLMPKQKYFYIKFFEFISKHDS